MYFVRSKNSAPSVIKPNEDIACPITVSVTGGIYRAVGYNTRAIYKSVIKVYCQQIIIIFLIYEAFMELMMY